MVIFPTWRNALCRTRQYGEAIPKATSSENADTQAAQPFFWQSRGMFVGDAWVAGVETGAATTGAAAIGVVIGGGVITVVMVVVRAERRYEAVEEAEVGAGEDEADEAAVQTATAAAAVEQWLEVARGWQVPPSRCSSWGPSVACGIAVSAASGVFRVELALVSCPVLSRGILGVSAGSLLMTLDDASSDQGRPQTGQ